MSPLAPAGRRAAGIVAIAALLIGVLATGAQAAPTITVGLEAPVPGQGQAEPGQDLVKKATIAFERTDAAKCPLTFKVHGFFEGLPQGAQTFQYRVVGTAEWKTVTVPADHGPVHSAVLETLSWDWETEERSVRIEINQPDGLRSNIFYYFKCGPAKGSDVAGSAAEEIPVTTMGGPLAELIADAQLEAVQTLSGAEVALVSKRNIRKGMNAGPVTFENLMSWQPNGHVVDVHSMTGAQLKSILAHANPTIGALTPSASMRYTLDQGRVTEITLNGAPVTDTQRIKIAANWILMSGWEGFPQWTGSQSVFKRGPDDTAALASYLTNHSPVRAPAGDRVTIK
ncbi:5'-nucleotidase C-terminal domain-containing protein [Nonomuraea typhae]|uniref:5'-nucleotidase C-terminal domain-containing protein n=1 Tax=Nonomuraea typhae TaxID=2603600 RepID=UPI0012F7ABD4|nr:5'-nucleotidase [Nonomuraea typhae]